MTSTGGCRASFCALFRFFKFLTLLRVTEIPPFLSLLRLFRCPASFCLVLIDCSYLFIFFYHGAHFFPLGEEGMFMPKKGELPRRRIKEEKSPHCFARQAKRTRGVPRAAATWRPLTSHGLVLRRQRLVVNQPLISQWQLVWQPASGNWRTALFYPRVEDDPTWI